MPSLTPRQSEVAALLAAGMTVAEIACRLYIQRSTVHRHIYNAMDRFSAATPENLVWLLTSTGVIEPADMGIFANCASLADALP